MIFRLRQWFPTRDRRNSGSCARKRISDRPRRPRRRRQIPPRRLRRHRRRRRTRRPTLAVVVATPTSLRDGGIVITLIHERPWQTLLERLDAIVAADANLAAARALLVAPITLLAAIAEDIEGALGDDRLALERLRALLSLSAVHSHPFSSMRALLSEPGGGSSG